MHPLTQLLGWRLLCAAILGLVLAGCGTKAPRQEAIASGAYPATRSQIARLIREEMEKNGVVGLSIALVDDQTVAWAEGFGYADETRHIPASPQTVYRAGSIAKLFTTLGILRLEEQGKVDIDQPLAAALPQFSVKSRFSATDPITPRNIMTHHSGLPCDLSKGMWSKMELTEVTQRLKEEYLAYPPDYVFAYSNLGYTLLGHMVQEVSGQDFVTHMDESVLRPMGMYHSSFALKPHMAPYLAKGYYNGREGRLLPMRDLPAAALYSNVLDLGRFMKTVFAGGRTGRRHVLGAASLEEMWTPQNTDVSLDFDFRIGLGWFLEGRDEGAVGPVALHGGTTLLFNSQLIILPRHKLGVAVLSNTSQTRYPVAKIAETTLKLALQEKTGITPPALSSTTEPIPPGTGTTGAPAGGQYATDLGLIEITPKVGQLCACNIGTNLDVAPLPNGWFQTKKPLLTSLPPGYEALDGMEFTQQDVDGQQVLVIRGKEKELLLGARVPQRPIPRVWKRRIGSYQVINEDPRFPVDDMRLETRDGLLYLRYRMPLLSHRVIAVPLAPISDTEAITVGLGRTRGETIRIIQSAGDERLVYSGYQARRIEIAEE